mmetsp:Transcript_106343/g.297719  ORF Transcript_106343/g.297719 Transcript_106343/m.297719 type:complete len:214 (-) Transcript_106343:294-935(-)
MSSVASAAANRRLGSRCAKTRICKFFARGHCTWGDRCSFAHDASELVDAPDLTRTKMCPALRAKGRCSDASCGFAHRREELRKVILTGSAGQGRGRAGGARQRPSIRPSELLLADASSREFDSEYADDGTQYIDEPPPGLGEVWGGHELLAQYDFRSASSTSLPSDPVYIPLPKSLASPVAGDAALCGALPDVGGAAGDSQRLKEPSGRLRPS